MVELWSINKVLFLGYVSSVTVKVRAQPTYLVYACYFPISNIWF